MHNTNDKYFSMMGLLDESNLAGAYNHDYWYNFNSLDNVLALMKKNETGKEDKHSIPDVYGRAIQYKISFESAHDKSVIEKNYFHSREILNWRGIITAIALQDFLELEMKIDRITYTDTEAAFDKALMHPPAADLFVHEKYWENLQFHILALKGDDAAEYTDIAMYSPLTVFYPIADLEKKMPETAKISWFDYEKREFLNPAGVLTDTEKRIVGFWARHFRNILIQQGNAARIILYHLDEYMKEIGQDSSEQDSGCFVLGTYDEECDKIMPDSVINNIMNQTVRLQLSIGAAEKIDYKDLFARQIYYTKKGIPPFEHSAFSENYSIKNTGSRGTSADQWYAFLPLGKKIAQLKDRATIHKLAKSVNMQVAYNTEGSPEYIQVSCALSNIDPDFIDAEKRYYFSKPDQVVEERGNLPVIAVWPPAYAQDCKKYYIYLQGGKTGKIEVAPDNVETGSNPYVKSVNSFPSAISLQRIPEGGKEVYDIGMLIPDYNDEPHQQGVPVTATVGIDFGTSGTTVYVRIQGKQTAFPVEIWADTSTLLTSAGKYELANMSQWFIANDQEGTTSGRLHSVYRRASKKKLETVIPILDGIIYQAGEGEMIEASDYYMPDIKWNDPMNGAYYEAFIKELCLHIWMRLREYAVTSVNWRYAFPGSLKQKALYQGIWGNNIQTFLNQNISGVIHTVEQLDFTESEAVSLYFQNSGQMEMVNVDKGYVVVDIGGGSTDIAVWQRRNRGEGVTMISQISVPVAGRMLFTRWISVNLLEIKRVIFPNDNEMERLKDFQGDPDIVNAILERIVNTKHDIIMRSYQSKDQWAVRLKEQLEFGVALLFFALGSFIGYLQQSGGLEIQDTKGKFSIALGGNGSKILDWLDDDDHDRLSVLFQEGIRSRNRSLQSCNSQIISSARPKEEVALGLLQDKTDMRKESIDVTETITAETAINWNRIFIEKYNALFNQNKTVVEDDIRALMANYYKPTNVCDFFMTIMYKMYYIDRIGQKGERNKG